MESELERQLLERLKSIEERVGELEDSQRQLQQAYGSSRLQLRRFLLRPPMWTYEQHSPRQLSLHSQQPAPALPADVPSIAIVTPSYNHVRFLRATIDSVLRQDHPKLFYHVQDGGSVDWTRPDPESYGDKISWRSRPDRGQADAINLGFENIDCDIMAYLNSDDILLPGTLAYIADFFDRWPDIDVVYGHRVFIDSDGSEIGRAILPAHNEKALLYAGYIPQETMFGAGAYGTRLAASMRVFNMRSTGSSCCVRRQISSSSRVHEGLSHAFACTTNRRRRATMMWDARR